MSTTATVDSNDGFGVAGNKRWTRGTFTTASGDSSISLNFNTIAGINNIVDYSVRMDTGGIAHQNPKFSISGGTITGTVDDTQGFGGTFFVLGN